MAQYINLGVTCSDFSEQALSNQPYGNDIFYILSSTTAATTTPFKTSYMAAKTFNIDATGSANSVTFTDYQFKVWWDEIIVRSGTNRSNWRVITPGNATTDHIISPYTNANHASNVISASSWPANPFGASPLAITYSADTPNNNYQLVHNTSTLISTSTSNAFINLLGFPPNAGSPNTSSGAPFGLTSNDLYILKSGTTYLKWNGSTLADFDTSTQPAWDPAGDTSIRFRFSINRTTTGRLFVDLRASSATGTDLTASPHFASVRLAAAGPTWSLVWGGNSYTFTSSPPSPTGGEGNFPAAITMLKFINTSKYLYWNGSFGSATATSSFSIKDYWQSGLSTSNVVQGMQYYFSDLFTSSNAAASTTGAVDYYRWYVHSTPVTADQGSTRVNKANVFAVPGGTVHVTTSSAVTGYTAPSTSEGWVLQSSTNPGSSTALALVYANVSTGTTQTPVVYANVASGGDTVNWVQWTAWNTLPSHAYSWNCLKCTPSAGSSTCVPAATTTAAPVVGSGTATFTQTIVAGIRTLTFTGSGTFIPSSQLTASTIFIVGGGGGGGLGSTVTYAPGGGGGGGGNTVISTQALNSGTTYTITIGAGGAGAQVTGSGVNGGATSFASFTANGGSGGTSTSGGAGGAAGTGGSAGAVGGGLGINGTTGTTLNTIVYGSGGGGGNYNDADGGWGGNFGVGVNGFGGTGAGNGAGAGGGNGSAGTANRGGGGGGGGGGVLGHSGGSGVVIITLL